jgi:hypothetical protein
MGKTITVHAMATVDGMRLSDIPPILMNDLQLRVVDAFDQKHPVQVKQGERLRFGQQ